MGSTNTAAYCLNLHSTILPQPTQHRTASTNTALEEEIYKWSAQPGSKVPHSVLTASQPRSNPMPTRATHFLGNTCCRCLSPLLLLLGPLLLFACLHRRRRLRRGSLLLVLPLLLPMSTRPHNGVRALLHNLVSALHHLNPSSPLGEISIEERRVMSRE